MAHCGCPPSQRDTLTALWRPTAFFLGAVAPDAGAVEAIRTLNASGDAGGAEVFKPQALVEAGCLNIDDLRQFAAWLVAAAGQLAAVPIGYREVNAELMALQKRRMVLWHLEKAPRENVHDALRMSPCPSVGRRGDAVWEGGSGRTVGVGALPGGEDSRCHRDTGCQTVRAPSSQATTRTPSAG